MFTSVALLAVLSASQHHSAIAERFCRALSSGELRAFEPLAVSRTHLFDPGWQSVRDAVERYESISVVSCRSEPSDDPATIILDADASGISRNSWHKRTHLQWRWRLALDPTATHVMAVVDDDRRRTARAIASSVSSQNADDVFDTATSLLEWSSEHNDSATESFALCALARVEQVRSNAAAASRMANAALVAADRADCDTLAYATVVAAGTESDRAKRGALLQSAAAAADSLDDPRPAFDALHHIFFDLINAYDVPGAYAVVSRLRDLARQHHNRQEAARSLYDEFLIDTTVHDAASRANCSRVIATAHDLCMPDLEARALAALAKLLFGESTKADLERAVELFERALRVLPPSRIALPAFIHANLGEALLHLGRIDQAVAHLEPALEASRRSGAYRVDALWFAEGARRAEGRYAEAIQFCHEGIAAGGESLWITWAIKGDLGAMLAECGHVDEGIDFLRQAIDVVEARRVLTTTTDVVGKAGLFASQRWVYDHLLRLLVDRHRFDEALEVAERVKARVLIDVAAGSAKLPLSDVELSEQRNLNQKLIDLNRALLSADGPRQRAIRAELHDARAALSAFELDVAMQRHPSAQSDPVTFDPTLADDDRVVIDYTVADNAVIALVLRKGTLTARILPRTAAEVERLSRLYAKSIATRSLQFAADSHKLYDALISPLSDLVAGHKAVTIVADEFLWNVPFAALLGPSDRYLVDDHTVHYAPSLSMLAFAARRHETLEEHHQFLAFGDPWISRGTRKEAAKYRDLSLGALPDAADEVGSIARMYGVENSAVFVGADARESTLKRLAGHYRVIHLATHGVIDHASPLYSAVVLASAPGDPDDGLLEMREMSAMRLRADLVVLSGCDTAGGSIYPGEGVIGMWWAFLSAGCPTTVVSQWKAQSKVTEQLMVEFHRRLIAGDSNAAALRAAQRLVMHQPEYRHPFYWAPFVVIGAP